MCFYVCLLKIKKKIMKKIIIMLAAGIGFTAAVNAQQVKGPGVPANVKSVFAKMYPGSKKVTWDKENGLYEASFTYLGQQGSVLIDKSGKWTEKENVIGIKELPQNVLQYLKEHYKTSPIKGAAKITKVTGEVNYEAEIRGKDVFFSQQGSFIKEGE
jgi:hypothetical protein